MSNVPYLEIIPPQEHASEQESGNELGMKSKRNSGIQLIEDTLKLKEARSFQKSLELSK